MAFCRALANGPRLLLADEPTGNLDPGTSDQVFAALMDLVRATGMAALIATHNLDLAARMDRVVRLTRGGWFDPCHCPRGDPREMPQTGGPKMRARYLLILPLLAACVPDEGRPGPRTSRPSARAAMGRGGAATGRWPPNWTTVRPT